MEIERKYLVKEERLLKAYNLDELPRLSIEQAYIAIDGNEVRIRKAETRTGDCKCTMTIKSEGDMVRNEIEIELPHNKYKEIIDLKMYIGEIIDKWRYRIPLKDGLTAAVDLYGKHLFGMAIVEVEFNSVDEAKAFIKPKWFGIEITDDSNYKNKNLARNNLRSY